MQHSLIMQHSLQHLAFWPSNLAELLVPGWGWFYSIYWLQVVYWIGVSEYYQFQDMSVVSSVLFWERKCCSVHPCARTFTFRGENAVRLCSQQMNCWVRAVVLCHFDKYGLLFQKDDPDSYFPLQRGSLCPKLLLTADDGTFIIVNLCVHTETCCDEL